MKKNYNQPIVEIEAAMFACQAICTSPGGSGLPFDPTPIPGGEGGD